MSISLATEAQMQWLGRSIGDMHTSQSRDAWTRVLQYNSYIIER